MNHEIYGGADLLRSTRTRGQGREGALPLDEEMLLNEASGNLFAMTQNVAMGWHPEEVNREQYVIVSTKGGLRAEDGSPIALGYHTGHWEISLLVKEAAETIRAQDAIPFAIYCSDPCDGRSQGTTGMMDSLAYRNDAALVMRRMIRSLPTRDGVMGVATCDKGLPAAMIALAGCGDLPGVIVPGGVTLPAEGAEDAGTVQTIGARFAHGLITLDYAAEMGCKACGSSGGGCQFLGTAATAQVVAEALGLSLPHSALVPSGEAVWLDNARRSALALLGLKAAGATLADILTPAALENAMLVHSAFGGSTNLLLHIPAIAHAAGLKPPTVDDWIRVNRSTARLVDALPNGPRNHPTVQVFMAGGVPEVMVHLRAAGLLNTDALTVTGDKLDAVLNWWESSDRRRFARERLRQNDGVNPDDVIMSPERARARGLTSTVVFPRGNIAPQGSVIKATAIDPSVIDADNIYRHRGRARVFTSERAAVRALKGLEGEAIQPGDVLVLAGLGPMGTGMEETYQLTSALKFIPWGKEVPIITDARFSGVSTGACIGHVGPEALAGGPIGKLRDGDLIAISIDREALSGSVDLVGAEAGELSAKEAGALLEARTPHPDLQPHPELPADTRLWAALQAASGGIWAGCVYDVDKITEALAAGLRAAGEGELSLES
ncbi:MAG: YjhG/YagF family D-xylonate dehydratase [Chloroflexota bacterium]|nr:YjhG/YagF family D-xylonate dehydratase [Chloroflexota bacterium]MDE2910303.1 YjhG/YagF family D-xylonate dehydratase [Chloroflexota bacterium]